MRLLMLLFAIAIATSVSAAEIEGERLGRDEITQLASNVRLESFGLTDHTAQYNPYWSVRYRIDDYGLVFESNRDSGKFVGIIRKTSTDAWTFIAYEGSKQCEDGYSIALTQLANDTIAIWFWPAEGMRSVALRMAQLHTRQPEVYAEANRFLRQGVIHRAIKDVCPELTSIRFNTKDASFIDEDLVAQTE